MRKFLLALLLTLSALPCPAGEALPASADPELEARVLRIASELRCLVCQNQTIADSHAGLAVDLRNQIRDMLTQGKSDAQILEFMTQRYGDFVLYRPPFKASTWLLWLGPLALLSTGLTALLLVLRRRSAMPAEQFEDEPPDAPPEAGPHPDIR